METELTIAQLIKAYEVAKTEWLLYLTFTGTKSEEGIKAYANMVKAGEALDNAMFPTSVS